MNIIYYVFFIDYKPLNVKVANISVPGSFNKLEIFAGINGIRHAG